MFIYQPYLSDTQYTMTPTHIIPEELFLLLLQHPFLFLFLFLNAARLREIDTRGFVWDPAPNMYACMYVYTGSRSE